MHLVNSENLDLSFISGGGRFMLAGPGTTTKVTFQLSHVSNYFPAPSDPGLSLNVKCGCLFLVRLLGHMDEALHSISVAPYRIEF